MDANAWDLMYTRGCDANAPGRFGRERDAATRGGSDASPRAFARPRAMSWRMRVRVRVIEISL